MRLFGCCWFCWKKKKRFNECQSSFDEGCAWIIFTRLRCNMTVDEIWLLSVYYWRVVFHFLLLQKSFANCKALPNTKSTKQTCFFLFFKCSKKNTKQILSSFHYLTTGIGHTQPHTKRVSDLKENSEVFMCSAEWDGRKRWYQAQPLWHWASAEYQESLYSLTSLRHLPSLQSICDWVSFSRLCTNKVPTPTETICIFLAFHFHSKQSSIWHLGCYILPLSLSFLLFCLWVWMRKSNVTSEPKQKWKEYSS